MQMLGWHARCILALFSSYVLGRRSVLSAIAFVSRRVFRRPIASVFLLYPARKEYADALAYQWHQRRFGWHPGLVGLYRQGGRYGMIFGIPNFEDEIRLERTPQHLAHLMSQMETVRACVGAERKVFAGILPSTFQRNGIDNADLSDQRELTARAVLTALDRVSATHGLSDDVPVLVLGGRGYIASEVIRRCTRPSVTSVDVGDIAAFEALAARLHGRPLVVINLTKSGALADYTDQLWPGVIVLNEVYPEPTGREIAALEQRGVACYHIVGVAGQAWPPFPKAYRGGIPCCAALPVSQKDAIPVVVARLSRDGTRSFLQKA
jgi:hypothetical protein